MYCGVMLKIGSYTPYSPFNCCSAKRTSSRATSMSLLFCSALRIASVNDNGTMLLCCTPTRVRSGNGGIGIDLTSGNVGSCTAGVMGVGCTVGETNGAPG